MSGAKRSQGIEPDEITYKPTSKGVKGRKDGPVLIRDSGTSRPAEVVDGRLVLLEAVKQ